MASVLVKKNMRLFGLPYQFMEHVDPRISTVSKVIGRKYAENVIMDAPVISIIPGKPKYLPGTSDKYTTTQAMLSAGSDDLNPLKTIIDGNNSNEAFKYYDFERSYTEYMKYVNILCRSCAAFLELNETIDGTSLQRYDWRNYKWNTESYLGTSAVEKTVNSLRSSSSAWQNYLNANKVAQGVKITKTETTVTKNPTSTEIQYETTSSDNDDAITMEELLSNYNYVQFFIDVDSTSGDSMSNSTSESKLKGMFDTGSDFLKELAFVINSGGIDAGTFQNFADTALQSLADNIPGVGGNGISTALSRILSLTSNVVRGENVIMPDIYQSSDHDNQYQFTVHLKCPYGTKFGYFMDICVPLMHLIALGIPKQTTANTYGSPFLIKAYVEGMFTCSMGIVSSISISKNPTDSSITVDGLPSEVDVTVTITDLYSDLSMSPQSSPLLFVNNTSLVEYLATTCGLSLVTPNMRAKMDMTVNAIQNAFFDIDNTVMGGIAEAVDSFVLSFLGLQW